MDKTSFRPQDVGIIKSVFPMHAPGATLCGDDGRKRGIHNGGAEHIWIATTRPAGGTQLSNQVPELHSASNSGPAP